MAIVQCEKSVACRADCAQGSKGPEVEGASALVPATGKRAATGALDWIEDMHGWRTRTQVCVVTAVGDDTL